MTVTACLGGYSGTSSKSSEQIVVGSRVSPGTPESHSYGCSLPTRAKGTKRVERPHSAGYERVAMASGPSEVVRPELAFWDTSARAEPLSDSEGLVTLCLCN